MNMSKEYLLIDIVNILFKSMLFQKVIDICINHLENKNKKMSYVFIGLIFLLQILIYLTMSSNMFISLFFYNVIGIIITTLVYYKKRLKAVVGFCFISYIIDIFSILYWNIYKYTIEVTLGSTDVFFYYNLTQCFFYAVMIFIYKIRSRSIIGFIELIIKNETLSFLFICGKFIFNLGLYFFLDGSYLNYQTTKIVFMVSIYSIIILIINYTEMILNKSRVIENMNRALKVENDELRKIKHDYGAQVSYLYGMFLLKRWNDLKNSLDKIIDTSNSFSDSIITNQKGDSIIRRALNSIIESGFHVFIQENTELEKLNINKDELFYIIENIGIMLSSLIGTDGMIIMKSYDSVENIEIDAETFEAEEDISLKNKNIFYSKFDEINILVKKNNGNIYFKHNKMSVKIKLIFPM